MLAHALIAAAAIAAPQPETPEHTSPLQPAIVGLLVRCERPAEVASFYGRVLAFTPSERHVPGAEAAIANGAFTIVLTTGESESTPDGASVVRPNFVVADLDGVPAAVRAAGGSAEDTEPSAFVLGHYVNAVDPAAHGLHIVTLDPDYPQPERTPALFNIGYTVESIPDAEAFLTGLGFVVRTRDYLPETLVLEPAGAGYIVIHSFADAPAANQAVSLLIEFADTAAAEAALRAAGYDIEPVGLYHAATGPSGNRVAWLAPNRRAPN